jgi:hypothetical protein
VRGVIPFAEGVVELLLWNPTTDEFFNFVLSPAFFSAFLCAFSSFSLRLSSSFFFFAASFSACLFAAASLASFARCSAAFAAAAFSAALASFAAALASFAKSFFDFLVLSGEGAGGVPDVAGTARGATAGGAEGDEVDTTATAASGAGDDSGYALVWGRGAGLGRSPAAVFWLSGDGLTGVELAWIGNVGGSDASFGVDLGATGGEAPSGR